MNYSIQEILSLDDYRCVQKNLRVHHRSLNEFEDRVSQIVFQIKEKGEAGLFNCIYQYDMPHLSVADQSLFESHFCIDSSSFSSYRHQLDDDMQGQILRASEQVRSYQEDIKRQLFPSFTKTFEGQNFKVNFYSDRLENSILGQIYRPLSCVGVYIPAGTAPLVSTVLMTALVAQVAGVKNIVVATPPNSKGEIHPAIIYACELCGVSAIYKMGGAHAIASLGYGIEGRVPSVDKIVGPGNIYVALAKKQLYGHVDIDMIAGPSEVLVVADEKTPVSFVALDLLAQLEHDALSSAQLIAPSLDYVKQVIRQIEHYTLEASRLSVIEKSLSNLSFYVTREKKMIIDLINLIAPEHLSLSICNASEYLPFICHAGAVFLGHYSPEAVGDYCAGPSHVLPTQGSSRFFSGLTISSFMKSMSVIGYHREDLDKEKDLIIKMAQLEGLDIHAKSVQERF